MSKFFSRLPVIINTRLSIVVVVVFMVLVVVVVVVLVNVNFVVSVVVVVDFPELCLKEVNRAPLADQRGKDEDDDVMERSGCRGNNMRGGGPRGWVAKRDKKE